MRKLHIMSIVMSLLSMLTVFSVGFASWLSLPTPTVNRVGTFQSYVVGEMSDYIKAGTVDMFEYSAFHFWNDDKTAASNTGKISVPYTIDLEKCAKAGGNWNGTVTLNASLWYENLTDNTYPLFGLKNGETYSKSVTAKIGNTTLNVTNSGSRLDVSHTLTGLGSTGTYTFTIDYIFTIPGASDNVNFRMCFGKYLKTENASDGTPTKFHMSAFIDW